MVDVYQLKEKGEPKYMKTHADAIDGITGKLVKATGNETVKGVKNFEDGIQVKGKTISEKSLRAKVSKRISTENSDIQSGSMDFYREGTGVTFSCSFQLKKVWYKDTRLITNIGTEYQPDITMRVLVVSTKGEMIYFTPAGEMTAGSDFQAGTWITASCHWPAKNA
ncbi:hypothetical protein [Enterococcus pallens]|uniref:Uncharacterized protein n=1 Tax=Enterococcus pallens ATCC BAA-351 TaxID=1158607 RepID=R2SUB9_9ENTE|nr:hypothetical protein [Enterococcus pallens]EOH96396.1 hypothetical protein UAU_01047 [Enterococcus pallens ATCC BAA-351]EOU14391.1 hypothetical protein I588_04747 [Enterococcus pallens ATCC BAA-351]OJG77304.1 hypothetical protein RV10_GL002561 [Enterococcus pallens]